jgi:hypothetical protein
VEKKIFIFLLKRQKKFGFAEIDGLMKAYLPPPPPPPPPHEIGKMASLAIEEFTRCNETKLENAINSDIVQTTWMRPPPEWFKINCDAAVDGNKGVIGGGLITRDSAGKPYATRSFTKRGYLDPTTAEAMVVVQAARFCKEMGVNNVIVEGDASTIIAALRET